MAFTSSSSSRSVACSRKASLDASDDEARERIEEGVLSRASEEEDEIGGLLDFLLLTALLFPFVLNFKELGDVLMDPLLCLIPPDALLDAGVCVF